MPIFILFASTGVLFDSAFSLWVSLGFCVANIRLEFKSSYQRCPIKKAAFRHFEIFTVNHLCWSLFFNKKRLQYSCFPVNIEKCFKTPILKNICKVLVLGVATIYLRKQYFIFLLLFVSFAWLLTMNKKRCYSLS